MANLQKEAAARLWPTSLFRNNRQKKICQFVSRQFNNRLLRETVYANYFEMCSLKTDKKFAKYWLQTVKLTKNSKLSSYEIRIKLIQGSLHQNVMWLNRWLASLLTTTSNRWMFSKPFIKDEHEWLITAIDTDRNCAYISVHITKRTYLLKFVQMWLLNL